MAYHNDTATYEIAVYTYDRDAGLTDRRVFASMEYRPDGLTVDAEGAVWTALSDGGAVRRYTPDGLTVDAEGAVWTALSDGRAVRRYTPDGELDTVIEVPARKATACTFGGADLDELFITTSREGLQAGEDPLAGALFHTLPGVRGLPVREFAG